jgi:ABC-type Fe3+ transport system substrate-binding protein
VINNAPHRHARLLFADFMIGRDGQQLVEQFR